MQNPLVCRNCNKEVSYLYDDDLCEACSNEAFFEELDEIVTS